MIRLSFIVISVILIFSSCKKSNPTEPVQNENTIEWVYVEGGTFQMGDVSGKGGTNKRPIHTVTVSGFFIGKFEVTNTHFARFMNLNSTELFSG